MVCSAITLLSQWARARDEGSSAGLTMCDPNGEPCAIGGAGTEEVVTVLQRSLSHSGNVWSAFVPWSSAAILELIDWVKSVPRSAWRRVPADLRRRRPKGQLLATLGPDDGREGWCLRAHRRRPKPTASQWDTDAFALARRDGTLYGAASAT